MDNPSGSQDSGALSLVLDGMNVTAQKPDGKIRAMKILISKIHTWTQIKGVEKKISLFVLDL